MTPTEIDIRESLLQTLSFLASETQQIEFAEKVSYDSFQDEFACWWFDTFYPEDPSANRMFSAIELVQLKEFSEELNRCLSALGNAHLTIDQLQSKAEWRAVVAKAQEANRRFQNAP